jgi:hypothetical protein
VAFLYQTSQAKVGQTDFYSAHYVACDLTIFLGDNEGFRKPSIQVNKKEVCVVLRQARSVYAHDTLQVIYAEFSKHVGFLQAYRLQSLEA